MTDPADVTPQDAHNALILKRSLRMPTLERYAQHYDLARSALATADQYSVSETELPKETCADVTQITRAARRVQQQIRETVAEEHPEAVAETLNQRRAEGGR